eukprot:m.58828 g.58828  ORF g.58828 m.58828 type:complete len:97 (-) comp22619_c0_seq1:61-351(-)
MTQQDMGGAMYGSGDVCGLCGGDGWVILMDGIVLVEVSACQRRMWLSIDAKRPALVRSLSLTLSICVCRCLCFFVLFCRFLSLSVSLSLCTLCLTL